MRAKLRRYRSQGCQSSNGYNLARSGIEHRRLIDVAENRLENIGRKSRSDVTQIELNLFRRLPQDLPDFLGAACTTYRIRLHPRSRYWSNCLLKARESPPASRRLYHQSPVGGRHTIM